MRLTNIEPGFKKRAQKGGRTFKDDIRDALNERVLFPLPFEQGLQHMFMTKTDLFQIPKDGGQKVLLSVCIAYY